MSEFVSRRDLLRTGALSLPLATVLADARLARAAASALEAVELTTAGGRKVSAAIARPAAQPTAGVILIHEWWGLNDQIKAVAAEFAQQGYAALAIDLYDGRSTSEPERAGQYMRAIDPGIATDTAVSWIKWLKTQSTSTSKVGTVGWCFGGGWSLNASIAEPVDATVIYYGKVDRPKDQLAKLKGPVLGHFATRDTFITPASVEVFIATMNELNKPLTVYFYDADHAFANPTGARYDAEDAKLAWERTTAFLAENLKG